MTNSGGIKKSKVGASSAAGHPVGTGVQLHHRTNLGYCIHVNVHIGRLYDLLRMTCCRGTTDANEPKLTRHLC